MLLCNYADNQLEMTTKRTIMENEQMSVELSYQSRQTEKLMSKNTVGATLSAFFVGSL